MQLIAGLLLVVHWLGCGLYILVREPDTWTPPKDLDKGYTDFYTSAIQDQYMVVYYYALLLLMGNDSAPISAGQTIYVTFVALAGTLYGSFLFGNMAALMENMNRAGDKQEEIDNLALDVFKQA